MFALENIPVEGNAIATGLLAFGIEEEEIDKGRVGFSNTEIEVVINSKGFDDFDAGGLKRGAVFGSFAAVKLNGIKAVLLDGALYCLYCFVYKHTDFFDG